MIENKELIRKNIALNSEGIKACTERMGQTLQKLRNINHVEFHTLHGQSERNNKDAFILAAELGLLTQLKYLILKEDKTLVHHENAKGQTALHVATASGHLNVVKWLLEECGADIYHKDSDGRTPLL